jgi:glyoxylase-like metal-dependent hydrolase (beta-lactamase superfamily II)
MRLTPDIALVGGGPFTGFGLTPDLDAHTYLLDGGDELALIDCGLGTRAGRDGLLGRVRTAGAEPARIRRLFVTHYHTDHAGGAGVYRSELGLTVAAAADVADALATGDPERTQFAAASALGFYPEGYAYAPCRVDDPLIDGNERRVGRLTIRAIATPGHCAGHLSYLVTGGERDYLFAGDAVFAGGRILLQAIPDCDLGESLASVRRLAATAFDALLPGHGAIVLSGGAAHVASAVAAIDRLAVPPSLV